MTPASLHFDDAGHWHQRAEEARALAEQMGEERTKKIMLRIAEDYGELAIRVLVRTIGETQRN